MPKITRRKWLAAAGTTTAVVGAGALTGTIPVLGQEATPKSKQHYNYKNSSPRELLQRRHFPNVELITQEGKKVHFYEDLIKDKRVVIQFMFTRWKDNS